MQKTGGPLSGCTLNTAICSADLTFEMLKTAYLRGRKRAIFQVNTCFLGRFHPSHYFYIKYLHPLVYTSYHLKYFCAV